MFSLSLVPRYVPVYFAQSYGRDLAVYIGSMREAINGIVSAARDTLCDTNGRELNVF